MKEQIKKILQTLGINKGLDSLSNQEFKAVNQAFEAEHGKTLAEALAEVKAQNEGLEKQREEVETHLSEITGNESPVKEQLENIANILAQMKEENAVLAATPESPDGQKLISIDGVKIKTPKVGFMSGDKFASLKHNRMAYAQLHNNMERRAGVSVDVSDLNTEFAEYSTQTSRPVFMLDREAAETRRFLQTIRQRHSWKAATAFLSEVMQQFIAKWTPKGAVKFTPNEIIARRHKINLELTPDEVYDSWVTHLYNEGLEPADMPITQFVLELLKERFNEDLELEAAGHGVFVALNESTVSEDDPGQAARYSVDGLITILKKNFAKTLLSTPTSEMNFFEFPKDDTKANLIENIEAFVDNIPIKRRRKPGIVFCSTQLMTEYNRAYQTKYNTKPVVIEDFYTKIDNSGLYLVGLPSIQDRSIFYTPARGLPGKGIPQSNLVEIVDENMEMGSALKIKDGTNPYKVNFVGEVQWAPGFAYDKMVYARLDAKVLAADDNAPDADDNKTFITSNNSGATAITDIANKSDGEIYWIIGNGATNASTIAKSGFFSEITGAWDGAPGNVIAVEWNESTSKFIELYVVNN